jgi:predicted RNase H-like nuclease
MPNQDNMTVSIHPADAKTVVELMNREIERLENLIKTADPDLVDPVTGSHPEVMICFFRDTIDQFTPHIPAWRKLREDMADALYSEAIDVVTDCRDTYAEEYLDKMTEEDIKAWVEEHTKNDLVRQTYTPS